jgi:hypothetical protein
MWRQFGDSCYYSSNNIYANQNPKASWHEARAKCEEKGGDLVSIHSKEENNFTTYLVKSPVLVDRYCTVKRTTYRAYYCIVFHYFRHL